MDILQCIKSPVELKLISTINKSIYQNNKPFPHIVIDNFLPEEIAKNALMVFPQPTATFWSQFNNSNEIKLATNREKNIPAELRHIMYALNSATFLEFLEDLTGIKRLISDPYLIGGGLHQIKPGGKLGIHVDFNRHEILSGLYRRLNLLLYMNTDWKEEYGGHFELHGEGGLEYKVLPIFNRCAIFSTSNNSYHGHPHPLTCPPNRTRKSIALYYYSDEPHPGESTEYHSTVFK